MIISALIWLLQDMFQVLAMGFMLVPELFLLVVVYKMVTGAFSPERISAWIWFCFFGGILWDLRWGTYPGMSALINVAVIVFIYWIWGRTPSTGRNPLLFAVLAGIAVFMSGTAHYFAWAVPSQAALRLFIIQQLITVPLLIVLSLMYSLGTRNTDV